MPPRARVKGESLSKSGHWFCHNHLSSYLRLSHAHYHFGIVGIALGAFVFLWFVSHGFVLFCCECLLYRWQRYCFSFLFGRVPQRQWQCVGRVAMSRMPLAVGLSGAPLRSGAPLHSAPSPSNPSCATAINIAPPFSGVPPSSAIATECATSCLSRQPHEPKLSATAAALRSTAGDFTARHSASLRNLRRQPHPSQTLSVVCKIPTKRIIRCLKN